METITKIEEGVFGIPYEGYGGKTYHSNYEGFLVETDAQVVRLLIRSGQSCCESYGYLMSEDKPEEFVGAKLLGIEVVDEGLNAKCIEAGENVYDGGAVFVNLNTDRGVLQFVAYNSHNGYYGHEVKIISNQLNHEECI